MKLSAALLAGSLAANAVLIGAFALRPASAPPLIRALFLHPPSATAGSPQRSPRSLGANENLAAVSAPPALLWSALPTDDLRRLITELQADGFPPRAIRAVVEELLDNRYQPRLRAFTDVDPATPYWKTAPLLLDQHLSEYLRLTAEYSKARRDLLAPLSPRDDSDVTSTERWSYGNLSAGKIDAINQIEHDYAEMTWQLRVAGKGIRLPEDQEADDLLDREKQADLASVLTPEELEGYDLRKSKVTSRLRPALTAFQASEAEFHTIYGIEDSLSDALFPATAPSSAEAARQQLQAEQQAAGQLRAALGDARYEDFMRSNDISYRQLLRLEQQENLPAGAVTQAYALRDTVAAQSNRIFDDASLSNEQKRVALQTLAQDTRTQLMNTLGPKAGPGYLEAVKWIGEIERGEAMSFAPTLASGITYRYRVLPPSASSDGPSARPIAPATK